MSETMQNTAPPTEVEAISGRAQSLRVDLAHVEAEARQLADLLKARRPPGAEAALNAEAIAQAMLAVRHVEDARMRLGKVLQYAVQGGTPYGTDR